MSILSDFAHRHIGPSATEEVEMLGHLQYADLTKLIQDVVPENILLNDEMVLSEPLTEYQSLELLKDIMGRNRVTKSFIGKGYHGTFTPAVIQRNILENPGWYTAYTPYQAEISQGRLEALLNFQTMVCELTALDVANASLLDEGTAAAEAIALAAASSPKGKVVFISDRCHSQTIDVVRTRTAPLGIELVIGDWKTFEPDQSGGFFAALIQYPDTEGSIDDFSSFAEVVHQAGGMLIVAADILSLTVLKAPGEFGADICVGSTQRFGVPMGFGGPHAAFICCIDKLKRKLPGRLVGVSKDSQGNPSYRLSLQTREQHIRRDKATSNICTAQVLLAVMASMYAVYHGPERLRAIAHRIHGYAKVFADHVRAAGLEVVHDCFFDTVLIKMSNNVDNVLSAALEAGLNLRRVDADHIAVNFDETHEGDDVEAVLEAFKVDAEVDHPVQHSDFGACKRTSAFLQQKVFNSYHSETEMLRYLKRLESKDLALNESMIALGSCTMKLNATSEMMPLSWREVAHMHPFAPAAQSAGYREMLAELSEWLAEITGFAVVSLQPNAGSQGEYAGLLAIKRYHESRGEEKRNICLIPISAHGTNPASAVMCGFKVVGIACDEEGNIDTEDFRTKVEKYSTELAALMVTYPSTHGVFEESVTEICEMVHRHGGQVYMDGANMNAQVGLTSPGRIGADVCHLNLHKTFCIPHGGGGPGVGPIGVASQLVPFLPGHETLESSDGVVCSAPWGSASINVISWMYISMMGVKGLTKATEIAILNANYIAHRLDPFFPVLYKGKNGLVAHECIIDIRPLTELSGVTVEDVAKRLMDYGYHAPTMSWPVAGTLMIEPTESESKKELDRFCDAMISIHAEIQAIISGSADSTENVMKNAPHTAQMVISDQWNMPYSREQAAYPLDCLRSHKFWPSVARIDNVHGDRNLVCTCEAVEAYE